MYSFQLSTLRRHVSLLFLLILLGLAPLSALAVASSTSLNSAPNPSTSAQSVTFTATVSGAPAAPPTGSVTFLVDGATLPLSTVTVTSSAPQTALGQAVANFSATLAGGPHTVTAQYNGDGTYSPSSVSISQTVQAVVSVSPVTAAPAPTATTPVVGQPVTLTAKLTGAYALASGTVTFSANSGALMLGTATVDNSVSPPQATLTTTTLPAGTYTGASAITASYSGDTYDLTGSGTVSTYTVQKADTTTGTPIASANPSTFGQAVTFTATVAATPPGAGTPTGTVTFTDSVDGILGTVSLNGGQASLTTATLSVSNAHSITASYSGDADFNGTPPSPPGLAFTVNPEPTTTSLTSSINPSGFGQPVVFTVTVTGANGVTPNAGTVNFSNGGPTLGSATLNANGQAQITLSNLPVGVNTITAAYAGTTNFAASSGTVSQTVTTTTNPITLTSTPNPSVINESVTFTATVTSSGVTPTGSIQFTIDGTNFGAPQALSAGSASISTSALSVGTHSITAAYSGDGNYNPGTSGQLTQIVNRGATTTALAPASATTVFGQPVTLTATITVSGPSSGTPTGTVQFLDGGLLIATVATTSGPPNTATASYTSSTLAAGTTHNITAIYNGDTSFGGSTSAASAITVNPASTTTSVTSGPGSASFGQPVTIVATVAPVGPGGGTPAGSVTFTSQIGAGPITTLGTVNLDNAGQASLTTSALQVGSNTITATYSPTGGSYTGSTGTTNQTVGTSATTVTVVSTPNPSVFGQTVTFTATVASGGPTPQGTIQFKDNGNPIPSGSGSLNPSGQFSITVSNLSVSTHIIDADFTPAPADTSSAASGTLPGGQQVNKASTGTTVSSSSNPQTINQPVTFTATITVATPGAGTPTGTIQFKDGATNLGAPAPVSTSLGVTTATTTTATLPAGTHNITAVYNGDGNFSLSTSPALVENIDKAGTTSTIVSAPNPSSFSQPVTFTATITGVGSITPTGTVTFQDTNGGTTTSLGTGTLSGSGNTATATLATSTLAAGVHSVVAVYAGDSSYLGSASASVTQTVNVAATATQVASSANPSTFSQNVTFQATVTSPAGIPTGTVTFQDDGNTVATTALDNTGKATFATSGLAARQHTITANFNPGTGNFSPSSGQVIQTVNPAASNVTANITPNPSVFGQTVTFTVVVSGTGGVAPSGTITFAFVGQTLGTATLAPSGRDAQNNPTSTATFPYNALPAGDDQVMITYSGDAANTGGSIPVTASILKAESATSVTSSANPSTVGGAVTFTATVVDNTAGSAGKPTGTVTFLDGGQPIPSSDPLNPNPAPLQLNTDGTVTASFATTGLSVATDAPHVITAAYNPDGNFNSSTGLLRGGQTVFDVPAGIASLSPSFLLVPGTSRDANHNPLGPSDSQQLTITGSNFRGDSFVLFNGDRLVPTVAASGTSLTVLIPPADVSVSGFAQVQVVNRRQAQSGGDPNAARQVSINPVKAIANFPVPGRNKFLRMFSIPFDYTAFSPYDVLAGVSLSPPLGGSVYNPDVNILAGQPAVLSGATTPLYHWDPASLLYQTTLPNADPAKGLKPADLHLTLGQGFWIVGGPETQTLGVMRLGIPAAFNPIGVPMLGGWNMIGDPFPRDVPLNTLRVLTPGGATLTFADAVTAGLVSPVLWRWDGTQYVAGFDGAEGVNGTLQQYEGYWLFSYQPVTLLVTFPQ